MIRLDHPDGDRRRVGRRRAPRAWARPRRRGSKEDLPAANRQNRAARGGDDARGHAADEKSSGSGSPVCSDHHEIDMVGTDRPRDREVRWSMEKQCACLHPALRRSGEKRPELPGRMAAQGGLELLVGSWQDGAVERERAGRFDRVRDDETGSVEEGHLHGLPRGCGRGRGKVRGQENSSGWLSPSSHGSGHLRTNLSDRVAAAMIIIGRLRTTLGALLA